MLKKKNVVAMMLAGVLMVGNVCPVMAANTSNEVFEFSAGTAYTQSKERPKENTTPVYVRVDATRPSTQIMVFGKIPNSNKSSMYWANCTYLKNINDIFVVAKPGINYSIRSTVYEKGGRSAQLRGRSVSGTAKSGGVWSPDSAGTYTFLN